MGRGGAKCRFSDNRPAGRKSMQHASRVEERVATELPVSFGDGSTGITRNISASGIYFEADHAPKGTT